MTCDGFYPKDASFSIIAKTFADVILGGVLQKDLDIKEQIDDATTSTVE